MRDIASDKKITRRPLPYSDNPHLQYLTKDLLKLIGKNLPANGYCAVGLTMEDLYPEDDWNFVFGQGTFPSPSPHETRNEISFHTFVWLGLMVYSYLEWYRSFLFCSVCTCFSWPSSQWRNREVVVGTKLESDGSWNSTCRFPVIFA